MTIEAEIIKLHIWDTCGEEKYRSINKNYYHDTDAAILVYDLTDTRTIDGVTFYMEQIKETCAEDPSKRFFRLTQKLCILLAIKLT